MWEFWHTKKVLINHQSCNITLCCIQVYLPSIHVDNLPLYGCFMSCISGSWTNSRPLKVITVSHILTSFPQTTNECSSLLKTCSQVIRTWLVKKVTNWNIRTFDSMKGIAYLEYIIQEFSTSDLLIQIPYWEFVLATILQNLIIMGVSFLFSFQELCLILDSQQPIS
jgi:hypothetical protein